MNALHEYDKNVSRQCAGVAVQRFQPQCACLACGCCRSNIALHSPGASPDPCCGPLRAETATVETPDAGYQYSQCDFMFATMHITSNDLACSSQIEQRCASTLNQFFSCYVAQLQYLPSARCRQQIPSPVIRTSNHVVTQSTTSKSLCGNRNTTT
jgi:hypothetical protein